MGRPTRSAVGCCVFVLCVVTHVQTHVFTQLLRLLYVRLHPNKTLNTAGPTQSYPHRWSCHWRSSRFHTGTGNYRECCYIFGCIQLEIQDRNTRRCLRSHMTAGVSRFHRNVCVCVCGCVLRSMHGCSFFLIFKLTVLAAWPLPAGFAHTAEGSLAIHAERRTLLVARVRRALVTDLWR